MKSMSYDNGLTFGNEPNYIKVAIDRLGFNTIVNVMDNDVREAIHNKDVKAKFSPVSFVVSYLRKAKDDLVVG